MSARGAGVGMLVGSRAMTRGVVLMAAPARRVLFAAFAAVCVLCACAGVARAKVFHEYVGDVTGVPCLKAVVGKPEECEDPKYAGSLGEVNAEAVDSGRLFVAEHFNPLAGVSLPRTDVFNASSLAFEGQLPEPSSLFGYEPNGVAVGHVGGGTQVYVSGRSGRVAVFGESSPGSWVLADEWTGVASGSGFAEAGGEANGVAVDGSSGPLDCGAGDVFVGRNVDDVAAKRVEHAVDVFRPRVEADGEVVEEFVTSIAGTGSEAFGFVSAVAVDQVDGDLLVGSGSAVDVFAPESSGLSCSYRFVRSLTGPEPGVAFHGIGAVAVDSAPGVGEGDVYVTEAAGVHVHAPPVYEFDAAWELVDRIGGEGTPEGSWLGRRGGPAAVAVTAAHDVVVGFKGGQYNENPLESSVSAVYGYGPDVVQPNPRSEAVSKLRLLPVVHAWEVTLNGSVDPVNATEDGPAECWFEWGTSMAFGNRAPCVQKQIKNVESVRAALSGGVLAPGTRYYYRLEASNKNGVNTGEGEDTAECEGKPAEDGCFTTLGPGLGGVWSTEVSASSVRFGALVDPREAAVRLGGTPVSYVVEYGSSGAYGQSTAPVVVGPGESDVRSGVLAEGLAADTTYHYRLVVSAEVEAEPERDPGVFTREVFVSADQTFTTQRVSSGNLGVGLLDGRGWELVSPVGGSGGVFALNQRSSGVLQASLSGDAFTYLSEAPGESGAPGYGDELGERVLSRHASGGWVSRDIGVPHASLSGSTGLTSSPDYLFFSGDLSRALVEPTGLDQTVLSPLAGESGTYVRDDSLCETDPGSPECFLPLLTREDAPAGTSKNTSFVDANENLTSAILRTEKKTALTEPALINQGLYEWNAGSPAGERLQLISILPNEEGGTPAPGSINIGSWPTSRFPASVHAVSSDGTRVFWTEEIGFDKRLYVRDTSGGETGGETLRLDLPQGIPAVGNANALFEAASPNGQQVLFTDTQRLTSDASKSGADLYQCTLVQQAGKLACRLRDLTPEEAGGPSEVQNLILGASEELNTVYFVANGALTANARRGDCGYGASATAECDLYVYHEGYTGLIARLGMSDELDWGQENSIYHNLGNLVAQVSPDGRYVAFMSAQSLTGYDNHDLASGQPDQEVYEYDAVTARLACVSCDPTGARPEGVEVENASPLMAATIPQAPAYNPHTWIAANLPSADLLGGFGEALYKPRLLSDGGRLFFNSTDALVPQDINKKVDVYEWEPPGAGSCGESSAAYEAFSGGCLGLVSSGRARDGAGLLDASESGSDVFFLTGESLVKKAPGGKLAVYDAHECGTGWECEPEPAASAECATADACRSAPEPQPSVFGAPASATFVGQGNPPATPATPSGAGAGKTKAKPPTRAQKLAKALAACKREKAKRKQAACEHTARARYGGKLGRSRKIVKGKKANAREERS